MQLLDFRILVRLFPSHRDEMLIKRCFCHDGITFTDSNVIQLNPAISKSQGKWKKFEIAGFRNNPGSVKFVTMNHFFNKIRL